MKQDQCKLVAAARLSTLHGFKGLIKARPLLSNCCDIFRDYPPVLDDGADNPVEVVSCNSSVIIISIGGVSSDKSATAFLGRHLLVPRNSFEPSTENGVCVADLLAMDVFLEGENGSLVHYGKIDDVPDYGGSWILEVKPDGSRATELYPFTADCFPVVDLEGGFVVLRKPDIINDDD